MQNECSRLKSETASLNTTLITLREALANEENRSLSLTKERDNLNNKLSDSLSISNELELVIKGLENDKESLNELLTKKLSECEQLSSELREYQNEAQSVRRMRSEALTQMEEVKTAKTILDVRNKKQNYFLMFVFSCVKSVWKKLVNP